MDLLPPPARPSQFNRAGLSSARPTASPALAGVTWTYTDVGSATYTGRVDRCDGTAWVMIVPPTGTSATAVAAYSPRRRMRTPPISKMVTTFASGHGWTTGGADNVLKNLNDTSDFVLGSQSAQVTSLTDGSTTVTFSKTGITAFDMTAKQFVVWVKVDDMSRLGGLTMRAGSDITANYYTLRVSGGAVTNSILNGGEWVPVTFSWADASTTGAPNRAAITALSLRSAQNGAGTAHVVRYNGVAVVADPSAVFPNGVVSVTFDDNYIEVKTNAKPRLDLYGYPATCYVIQDTVGLDANHLSLADLQSFHDQAGWEVAGHSWTAASHNQTNGLTDLSSSQLAAEMALMKAWLLSNGFTRGADLFAHPKGQFNTTTEQVIGGFFSSQRMTTHFLAQTLPFFKPRLGSMSVVATDSTASITAEIDKAYTNKTWLILTFHKIVASGASGTNEYDLANFNTVIDYLNTKGIAVRTVGQVLDTLPQLSA